MRPLFSISPHPLRGWTVGAIGLKCCLVLLTMPVSVEIYIALPILPEFHPSTSLLCNSYGINIGLCTHSLFT